MVDQRGKVMKDTDRNKKENIFFFFFFSSCILLVFVSFAQSLEVSRLDQFSALITGFPKTSLTDIEKEGKDEEWRNVIL